MSDKYNREHLNALFEMFIEEFSDVIAEKVVEKLETNKPRNVENTKSEPEFMNKGQTADYLSVSRTTIDRWIKTRNFPSSKVGGKYVYKREDVDRWVKENSKKEN